MARLLDIILDLVIAAVVARVLAPAVRSLFGPTRPHFSHPPFSSRPEEQKQAMHGEAVRDPVCGMFVSTELAHRLEWRGQIHYFCSKECLERYRNDASRGRAG
ncbi:MAG: YHS domain-containing protein [Terriglobia bacterium]